MQAFLWRQLQSSLSGPWGDRIRGEIEYLRGLDAPGIDRDELLDHAINTLAKAAEGAGVGESEVLAAEQTLSPLAQAARAVTVYMIAHAHIDMNWMWGYDETAVITVETLRTMLALMDEYPPFCFSQSQGSVYRIIERHAPELIDPIRSRINEGRWELSATQWTETDMNLPSTESLIRHGALTIPYLQHLFGVDRDRLRVAFMPDTFGHGIHTPELLAESGVRYAYHCRGQKGPYISWWRAPSGRSVLTYQDPRWYNETVVPSGLAYVSALAAEYGITAVPWVYGVGDHGGGPTRKDIEQIQRMQQWPIAPQIEFGTYHGFFERLQNATNLPVIQGERNPVFTGCYSSQQRIKEANRQSERSLYAAQLLEAFTDSHATDYTDAWRTTLFNHFHDILPGSGVVATREHALGGAQEALATTRTAIARSLRGLMANLTEEVTATVERLSARFADPVLPAHTDQISEGGGVGYGLDSGLMGTASRWAGWVRPFLVVNPIETEQHAMVDLTLWDWGEDADPQFVDAEGNQLACTVREGSTHYWGHAYRRLAVAVSLPGFGYDVIYAVPTGRTDRRLYNPYGVDQWLVEQPGGYVLENEHLMVRVRADDFGIASLVEIGSGREHLGSGGASIVVEHEEQGHMSSWIERVARRETQPGAYGRITGRCGADDPVAWLSWEARFGESKLDVRYELHPGSKQLLVSAKVAFREITTGEVTRVRFRVAPAEPIVRTVADAPGGLIEREPGALSVPVQRFLSAAGSGDGALALLSANAQGLGGSRDELWAVMLRASNEPDPAPDVTDHQFQLAVAVYEAPDSPAVLRDATAMAHPVIAVPFDPVATVDRRSLPGRLVDVQHDGTVLYAAARSATGDGIVLRLGAPYQAGTAEYRLDATRATVVDALEQPVTDSDVTAEVTDGTVRVRVPAKRVCSILIKTD